MTAALSPTHEMLAKIERTFDPHFPNRLANHPAIDRWVRGPIIGRIDLSEPIANHFNFCLTGEHGAMLFIPHMEGIYECHTMVIPAGRGKWGVDFVNACLHWMFCNTDMLEVLTKVPKGNIRALALVKSINGVYEFTSQHGWIMDNDPVPADIYSMHAQGWIRNAQGLRERGAWFHSRLHEQFARFGRSEVVHPDDPFHDQHVGAACEMVLARNPFKGSLFYNRFAAMGGYAPMIITSFDPNGHEPTLIDITTALIAVTDQDFIIASIL